jgi:hypothetical protein
MTDAQADVWRAAKPDPMVEVQRQETGKNYLGCLLIRLRPDISPDSAEVFIFYRPDLDNDALVRLAESMRERIDSLLTEGEHGPFEWQTRSDGWLQSWIVEYTLDPWLRDPFRESE